MDNNFVPSSPHLLVSWKLAQTLISTQAGTFIVPKTLSHELRENDCLIRRGSLEAFCRCPRDMMIDTVL